MLSKCSLYIIINSFATRVTIIVIQCWAFAIKSDYQPSIKIFVPDSMHIQNQDITCEDAMFK